MLIISSKKFYVLLCHCLQAAWLLRVVSCIDLTTLSGDDTATNIQRLCYKAASPIRQDLIKAMQIEHLAITTGAVCVYPNRVADCAKFLKDIDAAHLPIASGILFVNMN